MKIAKIRTAVFTSNYFNQSTHHICFLNPLNNDNLEIFDPKIRVSTPFWDCSYFAPISAVRHFGQDKGTVKPWTLISSGREYAVISHFNQNDTSAIEYFFPRERFQNLRRAGLQKKPIHVFDISISSYIQLHGAVRLETSDAINKVGPVIQNLKLVSHYESILVVGEITKTHSYRLTDFEKMTEIDVIRSYFEAHGRYPRLPVSQEAYSRMRDRFTD